MGRSKKDDLDLAVVDQAYGDFADLYSDVLRVSVVATHEQIQLAYFDRRSELFTLLAKIDSQKQDETTAAERFLSERKMDSVVLAVRVLGDPEQRLRYDRIRQERLLNRRRAEHGQLPGFEANLRVASGLDSVSEDQQSQKSKEKRKSRKIWGRQKDETDMSSSNRRKKKKERKRRMEEAHAPEPEPTSVEDGVVLNGSNDTQDTEHLTDDDSLREERGRPSRRGRSLTRRGRSLNRTDTDEMRQDEKGGCLTDYGYDPDADREDKDAQRGMLSCFSNSRFLKKISDEISGACEDTLVSVDQVFNAFTLTEKDIRAVTKRIDKAKKQLDN